MPESITSREGVDAVRGWEEAREFSFDRYTGTPDDDIYAYTRVHQRGLKVVNLDGTPRIAIIIFISDSESPSAFPSL